MKWILSRERLPDKPGDYYCKVVFPSKLSGKYIYKFDTETKRFTDDVGTLHTNSVAWLDESPLPSNEDELWEEVGDILKQTWTLDKVRGKLKSKFSITRK